MGEYSNRSNDPRITGAMKGFNKYDYDFALEVARQPASTAAEKKQQKRAATYARAYESRFPKAAFVESNRNPLSAGGKGAYKDPEKVKMNIKNPSTKKASAKYSPAPMSAKKKETKTATSITKSGRKITVTGSSSPSSNVGSKSVKPGSMVTNTKVVDSGSKKKASTKYSPAPMSAAAKAKIKVAAAKKQPSLTSKAAKVVGKVAGTAAGIAKSNVKANVKAAKTVAGFATKAAMAPSELLIKGAKAGAKALAKQPRPITKQMYSNKNLKKK